MGLIKRGKVWWMDFMFHCRRVRRSTETSDKRLAVAIFAKVTTQVVEGTFFDTREEADHTFRDMMERYLTERSNMKAPKSCVRDGTSLKHLVPVLGEKLLSELTPKSLVAYRTQRRTEGAASARSIRSCNWCGTPSIWRCGSGNGAGRTPCTVCPLSRCGTRWIVG